MRDAVHAPRTTGAGLITAAVAAAALAGALPLALEGQSVRGTVHDRATGEPVPAAFVSLLGAAGTPVSGVLTDGRGAFLHRSVPPGTYAVRVERIGFRTETFDPVEVVAGETVVLRLDVASEAIRLEAVTAEGEERCRMPRGEGVELAALWEQASAALRIAAWSEGQQGAFVRARSHERVRDVVTLDVVEERARTRGGLSRDPYFAAEPETLAEGGFVRMAATGEHVYYGLSGETILSRAFEDTHCFRVRPPARGQDPEEIGIAFRPVPGYARPGVEGVLWLDRPSGELRRVEYAYTRHLHGVPLPADRFGGETHFRRLDNGAWIVERWWIRMPEFERIVVTDDLPRGTVARGGIAREAELRRELRRAGLTVREVGGTVVSAALPGRAAAGTAVVLGAVHDSLAGGPLAGATVYVVGSEHEAETGPDGTFLLTGLSAAPTEVGFHHPLLDELGFQPEPVPLEAVPGDTLRLELATPSIGSLLARDCVEGETWLAGTVRAAADGRPLPGARVVAEWDENWRAQGDARRMEIFGERAERGAVSRESGWYVLCGVGPGHTLTVEATLEGWRPQRHETVVRRQEGQRLDFVMVPDPVRPRR